MRDHGQCAGGRRLQSLKNRCLVLVLLARSVSRSIRVAFDLLDLGGHIGDKRHAIARVLAAQHPNDFVGGRGCRIALGTLRGITSVTLTANFCGDDIRGTSLCSTGMGPRAECCHSHYQEERYGIDRSHLASGCVTKWDDAVYSAATH